jgi:hypothetical protein
MGGGKKTNNMFGISAFFQVRITVASLIANVGFPDTCWEANALQYAGHLRVPALSSVKVRKRFC